MSQRLRRVALLTGGGDAPGLNGVIESIGRVLLSQGVEVLGIQDGFEGVFEKRFLNLNLETLRGRHAQAGTLLGTSNKSRIEGREAEFLRNFSALQCDGLIAAGGDGTFAALSHVSSQIPLIGLPKTIDNDIAGTDFSFGFDTACSVVAESVDALRATAEAHRRVIFVEVMGRTTGWIAMGGGLAALADGILVPELPYSEKALAQYLITQHAEGRRGLVFVVSEAAHAQGGSARVAFRVERAVQQERFGGIAESLARWAENNSPWECRHVVLGHLQRSRAPTTTDRFLAQSMGVRAAQLALSGIWNRAVVFREGRVVDVELKDIQAPPKHLSAQHRWVRLARAQGVFVDGSVSGVGG
jgi:6-phosphofructokinase 1